MRRERGSRHGRLDAEQATHDGHRLVPVFSCWRRSRRSSAIVARAWSSGGCGFAVLVRVGFAIVLSSLLALGCAVGLAQGRVARSARQARLDAFQGGHPRRERRRRRSPHLSVRRRSHPALARCRFASSSTRRSSGRGPGRSGRPGLATAPCRATAPRPTASISERWASWGSSVSLLSPRFRHRAVRRRRPRPGTPALAADARRVRRLGGHAGIDWDWALAGVTIPALLCGVALLKLDGQTRETDRRCGADRRRSGTWRASRLRPAGSGRRSASAICGGRGGEGPRRRARGGSRGREVGAMVVGALPGHGRRIPAATSAGCGAKSATTGDLERLVELVALAVSRELHQRGRARARAGACDPAQSAGGRGMRGRR